MIVEELQSTVRRSTALVLDTNVLLLRVIGELGHGWVTRFKRVRERFDDEDVRLLLELLSHARLLVTTPHILAETSNLLAQAPSEEIAYGARRVMLNLVRTTDERWPRIDDANTDESRYAFQRFGVSDWGLTRLASDGCLILTDDLILLSHIQSAGGDGINFNHLR